MGIPARIRTVFALALLGSAAGAAELSAQDTVTSDSAAVAEVVERYHGALAAGDTAAAMSLLADGAIILESGGMESREEYRSHHLPSDMDFAAAVPRTRGPLQVRINGNTAWVASTSVTEGTFRDRAINAQGAELMVLSRTDAGWLIEAIHWSSRNRR